MKFPWVIRQGRAVCVSAVKLIAKISFNHLIIRTLSIELDYQKKLCFDDEVPCLPA